MTVMAVKGIVVPPGKCVRDKIKAYGLGLTFSCNFAAKV
jgi:hypothetical protein